MKYAEITVLERDLENVIKFLGRTGELQLSYPLKERNHITKKNERTLPAEDTIDKIKNCARYLGIELPSEPFLDTECVTEADNTAILPVCETINTLEMEAYNLNLEKGRIESQLTALSGFENIADSLSGSDSFSFLNLKIGRLDPEKREKLVEKMGERALIVPLSGGENKVFVASAKKERFGLESELKEQDFVPAQIPDELSAAPSSAIHQLKVRLDELPAMFCDIDTKKTSYREVFGVLLQKCYASHLMSKIIAEIKSKLVSTGAAYIISGWVSARTILGFVTGLEKLTDGRVAVLCLEPWEAQCVRDGREKIPVRLKHGRFSRAFEPLVFSYGAPLYGAIDPTPITAFFFTLLFAIMFGDVGQGFILFLLGVFAGNRKIGLFKNYRHFAAPLKVIGCASMITGLLYGSVFSNEELLHAPTEFVTGVLSRTDFGRLFHIEQTGVILNLMPHPDNMGKIFAFFGCTLAAGVVLNSIGLIINIMNKAALRDWEKALFSRNGSAGLVFFWYAISIAVRAILFGDKFCFSMIDTIALIIPVLLIAAGPAVLRFFTGKRPVFEESLFAAFMEGIVEILETLSGYISNTVSFLRVGAFALSHAVLSFIVWTMAEKTAEASFGTLWGIIIILFGNLIIILLEGMIVAIQVTRLQYYEFFSKFFTSTGVKFTPFRFQRKS
jgi:V/A-type H+-transporting ATPase subunit I